MQLTAALNTLNIRIGKPYSENENVPFSIRNRISEIEVFLLSHLHSFFAQKTKNYSELARAAKGGIMTEVEANEPLQLCISSPSERDYSQVLSLCNVLRSDHPTLQFLKRILLPPVLPHWTVHCRR